MAIRSFRHDLPKILFERRVPKRFPAELANAAYRRLIYLAEAVVLDDLKVPPGNRFEALKGNRKGQYSIRINDQWRICFRWVEGAAEDVEIVDYHD